MKVILAGSPQIAIQTFEKIINNFDVVSIITNPDKKKGRNLKLKPTKVSLLAQKYNIKCFKPQKIISIYKDLEAIDFDIIVTFAYGQLIPTQILKLGTKPPINIHASMLPKYRGAAPIIHSILNDEKIIGISIIEMIKAMDAGDIFFKASIEIDSKITSSQAYEMISNLASENIVEWLNKIDQNNYLKTPQAKDNITFAPKINKNQCEVTNNDSVYQAIRKIRAFNYNLSAFIFINQKRLKIFNAFSSKDLNSINKKNKIKNTIEIKLKDGKIFVFDYQWENKKRVKLF